MVFFSLATTTLSSIFYGIIATAAIMAILYVALKSVSKGIVATPVFYVTGVVLAVLLVVETSLLIGAVQAKSAADVAELSHSMHETMLSFLNSYIWHRVGWIVGFILIAVLIVFCFAENRPSANTKTRRRVPASRKNYDDF